nr:hypothetical protein [Pectobacterium brasiliense]
MLGTFSTEEVRASGVYTTGNYSGRITLSNPQEQVTTGGKRICIYSNSIYTFTTVTRSQSCPYSKTFDTKDSE